jgi:hypothetical protein
MRFEQSAAKSVNNRPRAGGSAHGPPAGFNWLGAAFRDYSR